jgi:hypothetical protein
MAANLADLVSQTFAGKVRIEHPRQVDSLCLLLRSR